MFHKNAPLNAFMDNASENKPCHFTVLAWLAAHSQSPRWNLGNCSMTVEMVEKTHTRAGQLTGVINTYTGSEKVCSF